jgi:hypothetical protein
MPLKAISFSDRTLAKHGSCHSREERFSRAASSGAKKSGKNVLSSGNNFPLSNYVPAINVL